MKNKSIKVVFLLLVLSLVLAVSGSAFAKEVTGGTIKVKVTGQDYEKFVVDKDGKASYETKNIEGAGFVVVADEDIYDENNILRACKGDTLTKIIYSDKNGDVSFDKFYYMQNGCYLTRESSEPTDLTLFIMTTPESHIKSETREKAYFGKYRVIQKVVPEKLEDLRGVVGYEAELTLAKSNVTIDWFDHALKGFLKIYRIDKITSEPIPNTGIRIYKGDKKIYEDYTDENGIVNVSYLPADDDYWLEEFDVTKGTIRNTEKIEFEIIPYTKKSNDVYLEDYLAMGKITVNKTGEDGANIKIEDGEVKYENIALEGVKFKLVAAEDIVSPTGVVKAYKGDTIAYATSNEEGQAIFDGYFFMSKTWTDRDPDEVMDLTARPLDEVEALIYQSNSAYLGKYIVQEVETVEGYRFDETEYEVSLEYVDDKTELIEEKVDVLNEIKKGNLEITKEDLVDGKALPNTGIRIYRDGEVIFEGRTDNEGQIVITGLPEGKYQFQEFDAPEGYEIDESLFDFEIKDGEITKATMTNKAKSVTPSTPDTGIQGGTNAVLIVAIIIIVVAIAFMVRLLIRKRKAEKEQK